MILLENLLELTFCKQNILIPKIIKQNIYILPPPGQKIKNKGSLTSNGKFHSPFIYFIFGQFHSLFMKPLKCKLMILYFLLIFHHFKYKCEILTLLKLLVYNNPIKMYKAWVNNNNNKNMGKNHQTFLNPLVLIILSIIFRCNRESNCDDHLYVYILPIKHINKQINNFHIKNKEIGKALKSVGQQHRYRHIMSRHETVQEELHNCYP